MPFVHYPNADARTDKRVRTHHSSRSSADDENICVAFFHRCQHVGKGREDEEEDRLVCCPPSTYTPSGRY